MRRELELSRDFAVVWSILSSRMSEEMDQVAFRAMSRYRICEPSFFCAWSFCGSLKTADLLLARSRTLAECGGVFLVCFRFTRGQALLDRHFWGGLALFAENRCRRLGCRIVTRLLGEIGGLAAFLSILLRWLLRLPLDFLAGGDSSRSRFVFCVSWFLSSRALARKTRTNSRIFSTEFLISLVSLW